tara:strand:- start:74948 stop:75184 length:237 start_codon:yes stop_codon:yes gene_type:complete
MTAQPIPHQQVMIAALERALEDARSGRLVAFTFAGLGRNETVTAFAFDETDPEECMKIKTLFEYLRAEMFPPPMLRGL